MVKKLEHWHILLITTIITIFYYCIGINSWRFAFVGDEWPFYIFARQVLSAHFLMNPFDFHGVYNFNTILSSMYQALFLQLFGTNNFAWRFSNIILIIPITIFFYLWLKKLFTPRMALISTLILQSSFYLANFFKIGYNNPQALPMLTACLFMSVQTVSKPTRTNFFILGILLGVSFYIYIGPIFPLLIWPFFIPLLHKKHLKTIITRGLFLVLGYALVLLPSLINFAQWDGPAGKTFAHKEYEGYTQTFINIYHNFLLFFHNYDYLFNHFVAGPYMDWITGICIIAGTIMLLTKIRRLPYLMLLLSFISTCIVIGITSPYAYSPTTRGIFFLPFGAALAGIALTSFSKKYSGITVAILVCIFYLNVYISQIGVFKITGYSATALVIQELQSVHASGDKQTITLLLPPQSAYFGYTYFPAMQQAYGIEDVMFKVVKTDTPACTDVVNTRVLIFAQDEETHQQYVALACTSKPQPVILYPSIFL